jgi:hypothetical protein
MVDPESAPAQLARKDNKRLREMGARCASGMLCMSQYTWKTSKPRAVEFFRGICPRGSNDAEDALHLVVVE